METTQTNLYMLFLEIPNASIRNLSSRVNSFLYRFNQENQDDAEDQDDNEGVSSQTIADKNICNLYFIIAYEIQRNHKYRNEPNLISRGRRIRF